MTLASPALDVPVQTSTTARVLSRLGGSALVGGPALFLAGLLTSPPGDTTDPASSISAFAAHPTQTQVSGLLLHYGLVVMSLGLLAVPGLVFGRRGRIPAVVGSLITAIGMVNVSGGLRDDWWRMAAGQSLSLKRAVALAATTDSSSLLVMWDLTEVFAFIGVLLVLAALGRAGVLSWGWLGAAVVAFAATMVVPGDIELWPNVVFGAFIATLVPVGVGVLRGPRDA